MFIDFRSENFSSRKCRLTSYFYWSPLTLPGELYLVFVFHVGSLYLCIVSVYLVSVFEMPSSFTLWLIVIKGSLEVRTVWIDPFTLDELSRFEQADILHTGLIEHISALAVFLSILPLSRVDVFIGVNHNSFSVSLAIQPVTIVLSNIEVRLLSNAVFLIHLPLTFIGVFVFFIPRSRVGIGTIHAMTESILELTVVNISIWVSCSTFTSVVS